MALTKLNLASGVTGTLPTSNYTAGVTVADNWSLSSTASISSGTNFLTANWEQNDSTGFNNIGTALTQSSGIFTFPSTGIYQITYECYATLENDETGMKSLIAVTIDNSSYTNVAYGSSGIQRSSGNYELSSIAQFIFDVTDTSNCKIKFGYEAEVAPASSVVNGSTNNNRTNFIAIRLGDT